MCPRPTVTRALNALRAEFNYPGDGSGACVNQNPITLKKSRRFGIIAPQLGKGGFLSQSAPKSLQEQKKRIFPCYAAHLISSLKRRLINHCCCKAIHTRASRRSVLEPLKLELEMAFDTINQQVISILDDVNIPVILIDSDYVSFPARGRHDLVSIDNFRAGYAVTQYFADRGNHRTDFLARSYSAHTVDARLKGYLSAWNEHNIGSHRLPLWS